MMREKINVRDTEWNTLKEIEFIDEAISGLSHEASAQWLERYREACLKRNNWGRVSAVRVINHIDYALLMFRRQVGAT